MFMKIFIALSVISVILSQISNNSLKDNFKEFQQWSLKYSKKFDSVDHLNMVYNVFNSNKNYTNHLNNKNGNNTQVKVSPFGNTKFSDMNAADFKKVYLNLDVARIHSEIAKFNTTSANITNKIAQTSTKAVGRNLQNYDSWDWRIYGVVTAVKNQGQCGDCYAFATTGNFEGLYALSTGILENFAEQQVLDCEPYDLGCNGGSAINAITYILYNGLATTRQYGEYTGVRGTCTYEPDTGIAFTQGYYTPGSDEVSIANFLQVNGPLAVAINADPLQYYTGGIIDLNSNYCDPYSLDHAVLIVGYGTVDGIAYWIVKNSWGPDWGEEGFFRMARGYGVCGINNLVYTAVMN